MIDKPGRLNFGRRKIPDNGMKDVGWYVYIISHSLKFCKPIYSKFSVKVKIREGKKD